MNTVGHNNKHTHLAALAYSTGRVCLALTFALSLAGGAAQSAPTVLNVPGLGSASRFAVLSAAPNAEGALTFTNSTIFGDVGTSGPIGSVVRTGGIITGSVIAPVTPEVLADFNRAYEAFGLLPSDHVLSGTLAGVTLPPAVYRFDASAALTGKLTLIGPANAIWVFRIGGALTTTGLSSVVLAGGAQARNIYWWVAEGATLTDSDFVGTILAGANALGGASITITRGAFTGMAFAKAAVTITDTTATKPPARMQQPNTTVPASLGDTAATTQTDRSAHK